MDKNLSLTFYSEGTDYRSVAQKNWGLTDEQMNGVHVHHHPPKALGGRNIPEHLYVCSPDMHLYGWHKGKGSEFPRMASEGGKLSSIVRNKKAKEKQKLSPEDRKKDKEERKRKRELKKKEEIKRQEYRKRVAKALEDHENREKEKERKLQELNNLQNEMIKTGLILPDPIGLLL